MPENFSGKAREKWIDCVKCVAILVVLLNHSGFVIPGVNFWGGMFFVPVFFVVSGFTYHTKEESFLLFLKRKAKRLLLPYITANGVLFLFFLLKDVVVGSKNLSEMLSGFLGIFYSRNQLLVSGPENVYLMTNLNSPTWFLTALFLTIVVFELLVRRWQGNGKKMMLVAVVLLLLANLYHYLCPMLLPWSADAVPYFLLFFMWGRFMKEKEVLAFFDRKKGVLLLAVVIFVVTALINGSANFSIADYGVSTTLALYNGVSSSTLLMYLCLKCDKYIPKFIVVTGQHTLFILCYHLFLFEIFKTVLPGIHPVANLIMTTLLLSGVGIGADVVAKTRIGAVSKTGTDAMTKTGTDAISKTGTKPGIK